jgi:hypothetical protein
MILEARRQLIDDIETALHGEANTRSGVFVRHSRPMSVTPLELADVR